MTKAIKNKILNIENPKKCAFWSFVSLVMFFSASYMYFLNRTVVNAVERQNIEKEITLINSRTSDLEESYLSLKNKMNIDYALSKGFIKVSNEKYVSAKTFNKNLLVSVNRI